MIWQFAACLPFFLFCALSVPAFLVFCLPFRQSASCSVAGIVLIGLQVWLSGKAARLPR